MASRLKFISGDRRSRTSRAYRLRNVSSRAASALLSSASSSAVDISEKSPGVPSSWRSTGLLSRSTRAATQLAGESLPVAARLHCELAPT